MKSTKREVKALMAACRERMGVRHSVHVCMRLGAQNNALFAALDGGPVQVAVGLSPSMDGIWTVTLAANAGRGVVATFAVRLTPAEVVGPTEALVEYVKCHAEEFRQRSITLQSRKANR